ncbi:hypothetical protein I3842_04G027300 [Carya illinoinensis]|uniref:Transmembrane protein n=1 Tax=Carya illinoinensis TaxID=32201 RepID=A0A922FA17_CARIL|nr:hypothetical protein I3842_04G027300 [Carya illinoinensis]
MRLEASSDTTALSYWLNWRVVLCAAWVLMPTQDRAWISHEDKAWRTCLKEIHPIWLLAYRVIAFCLLLGTIVVKVVVNGGLIFFYYTQLHLVKPFILLVVLIPVSLCTRTNYESLLSVYECYQYNLISSGDLNDHGLYLPLTYREITNKSKGRSVSDSREGNCVFQVAGICSYVFEVIFQMSANMHTLNARVPLLRISFFVLWTGAFVLFQCPSPFLDLSSPYAPLWYFLMALIHVPCYGIFALIVHIKLYLLSKWFPLSYQF